MGGMVVNSCVYGALLNNFAAVIGSSRPLTETCENPYRLVPVT